MDQATFSINDTSDSSTQVRVCSVGNTLAIHIDGYEGTEPGGPIISICKRDRQVVVEIRAEILRDEPTQVVSLENASVARRCPEVTDILSNLRKGDWKPFEEASMFH